MQNFDQSIIDRLRAGENVPGYHIGTGNYTGPAITANNDGGGDPGNYERVIYGNGGGSLSSSWWDTWDLDGKYRGAGTADSTTMGLAKFVAAAVGGYYATQFAAGLGATAEVGTGAMGGDLAGAQYASGAGAMGGDLAGAQYAAGAAGGAPAPAASTSLGGGAASKVASGVELLKNAGVSKGVEEAGRSILDSKLANTALNVGAGILGRYAQHSAEREDAEAVRQRKREGVRTGAGLSIWRSTPSFKVKPAS